jgi:hypothetical protein
MVRARDALVSNARYGSDQYKSDWKSFQEFCAITGAGDHPALARILHNAARLLDEPQSTSIPTDIKPSPKNGPAPKGIYTHPSSAAMNRA